jgi:hypothetical protein
MEQLKDRWMLDQREIEVAMDVTSDGSEQERWISEQSKERWMLQAMDQRAIEGAMGWIRK